MRGFRGFLAIWAGQLVSVIGSRLSSFALGIWMLQKTGSTVSYAMMHVSTAIPALLISPMAGAFVDRSQRKRVLLFSDSAAALATVTMAVLLWQDLLEPWHVYLAVAAQALANAFQMPAYQASISLLVPKEQIGRANGLVQTAFATAQVLGPLLAGALVSLIALAGVLTVDFITFLVAVATLSTAVIPQPEVEPRKTTLWADAHEGYRFIRDRAGLWVMLLVFASWNFLFGILGILITPLVLSFTTPGMLGVQMSIGGCGLLLGGLAISAWGGPRKKIPAMLAALAGSGVFLILHGLTPSFTLIAASGFAFFALLPLVNTVSTSIWQVKVPPGLQGRCFAMLRLVSQAALPISFGLAGPLADYVFEPWLAPGGMLANSVGLLIGVGPGRGIALIFIVVGTAMIGLAGLSFLHPRLRRLEEELPDALLEPRASSDDAQLDPDSP